MRGTITSFVQYLLVLLQGICAKQAVLFLKIAGLLGYYCELVLISYQSFLLLVLVFFLVLRI